MSSNTHCKSNPDEFLSTHSAKSLSAVSRVRFPSLVGSMLSLGQRLVVVSVLHQQGSSTHPFVYLLMSAGRHGLFVLDAVTLDRIKPSISVSRVQMITGLLLCSVSLVQALLWLQHKSTFHHGWKYERPLWDWREPLNIKPTFCALITLLLWPRFVG